MLESVSQMQSLQSGRMSDPQLLLSRHGHAQEFNMKQWSVAASKNNYCSSAGLFVMKHASSPQTGRLCISLWGSFYKTIKQKTTCVVFSVTVLVVLCCCVMFSEVRHMHLSVLIAWLDGHLYFISSVLQLRRSCWASPGHCWWQQWKLFPQLD